MSVNVKQNGALTKVGGLYKESTPMSVAEYYSTDEHKVGVWVDGKPLYQKTFIIVPSASSTSVDISSLNIDKLVSRKGTVRRENGSTIQQKDIEYRTEPSIYNAFGFACEILGTDLIFNIEGYTYSEVKEARITIQYTKTTDNVTVSTYAPIVPMNIASKYSTEEKVVGQWTDGKPLYQRTFEITNVTVNDGWTQIASDNNIEIKGFVGESSYCQSVQGEIISFNSFATTTYYTRFLIYDSAHKAQIYYNNLYNLSKVVATLQYTKTTDTANTGLFSDDEATLEMLGDVEITDIQDGDGIKWDDTAKKWINGEVGGGGAGGGVGYIDFTNILYESGQISSNLSSYSKTVTEDCWLQGVIKGNGSQSAQIFVNGEIAGANMSAYDISCLMPVRAGDVITLRDLTNVYYHINLYGYTGANAIDIASIYSTEEREIGCFVDGKPLYQKTIELSTFSFDSTWKTVYTDATIENLVSVRLTNGESLMDARLNYQFYQNNLQVTSTSNFTLANPKFTITYTKVADTAGSGKWTPNGNYAEHYSEQEQVIGTWIDGSTLYEKTVTFNSLSSGNTKIDNTVSLSTISLTSVSGALFLSDGQNEVAIPYATSTQQSSAFLSDGLYVHVNNLSVASGYVTIKYIKKSTS